MIDGKKVLAVIPARGGSKRLPVKNIMPLNGKPLIGWTIEAALASSYIDEVIVSTDCLDIKNFAEQFGASVPFLRPDILSTDTASSIDTVIHAIDNAASIFSRTDIVILLQPTSPLRNTKHIDEALIDHIEKDALGIISVCECKHSPLWCNTLPKDLSMEKFIPKKIKNKRSQDLSVFYRLNGAIYVSQIEALKISQSFIHEEKTFAYVMDYPSSVDIDEELDFKLAEFLMLKNK